MNPKIQRVMGAIEKTKRVIAAAQSKLKDLEEEKLTLENAELVAAMRGMKATPEEFEAFLAQRRGVSPERGHSDGVTCVHSDGGLGDEA